MIGKTAAVLAASMAAPACAQVQPWPDVLVSGPLGGGKWLGAAQVVGRLAGGTRPSQLETRLQIGRPLGRGVTGWIGWARVASYVPDRPGIRENQIVEQLNWLSGATAPVRLATRTRLEQRFPGSADGTSWRLRQQVRGTLSLGAHLPALVLWAEPFLALNRTATQQRTLDQLRIFAGVAMPLSRRADVEIGYLDQHLYRGSGGVVNHAIPLVLAYRF